MLLNLYVYMQVCMDMQHIHATQSSAEATSASNCTGALYLRAAKVRCEKNAKMGDKHITSGAGVDQEIENAPKDSQTAG